MIKNGKDIKCKTCKKKFYIPNSRFGTRKYCSRDCAKKDNFGFKPKVKRCVICNSNFTITSQLKAQKKTCNSECHRKLVINISRKSAERRRKIIKKKKCKNCKEIFEHTALFVRVFCSNKCQVQYLKTKRKGKGNPNYRGGYYTKENYHGTTAWLHAKACKSYRNNFTEKHGYIFCEVCGVNSVGTIKHDTHHIYSAGKYPKHKELHNQKNLVMVCRECHLKFHGNQMKEKFKELEKKRGLKEIFNKT